MRRVFFGACAVALGIAAGCSSDDASPSGAGGAAAASGSAGSGGAGGSGGITDAGCDAPLLDGSCPGAVGGGGSGGTAGGSGTCEAAGRLTCPAKPADYWDVCDRIAYECKNAVGLGFTSSTGCDPLVPTEPNPLCCIPWDALCKKQETDCPGGVAECFKCRDESGGPYDPNACSKAGAACVTNDECCKRCCRANGTCA